MKKPDWKRAAHILHAAEKRFLRSIRNTSPQKGKSNRKRSCDRRIRPDVEAPAKIDLYSTKNHSSFITFLEKLRNHVKNNKITTITFRNTTRITAAAGLILVAETDRLTKAFPEKKIRCFLPPRVSEGRYRNTNNTVESALNQIGFFKLINQNNHRLANLKSVSRWKQLSGETADGSLARSLLDTLGDKVTEISKKKIYRGAIEAIANCVEHAYPANRPDGLGIDDRRWWMLVGLDETNLSVIVCDLGVGIPSTLPAKHPETLLQTIKQKFSIFGSNDSDMIVLSSHIKQTRTKLYNRGKGGKDFRSIIRNFPTAVFTIRSNKGVFSISGKDCAPMKAISARRFIEGTNRTESVLEHTKSIRGTLLEWVVPLKDLAQ
ncbi:hypothetical protein RBK84_21910 [Pseudomonas aeruginosa]|uniref:hypothetical protein n=1 Tax=Pseudomonas aeruginosa TaxID=287 RepID=UPI0027D3C910|nr:hypothetical protein [Pseudomonas aeruginosa]MDQ4227056.1 hypothetical protein [Pseudomonas aeruginosa]